MSHGKVHAIVTVLALALSAASSHAVLITYLPFNGNLTDVVGGNNGTSVNPTFTVFAGRHALDANAVNGQVRIASPTGVWSGSAVANNEIAFSLWQQDPASNNSSTFWADTQGGILGNRGAQAHIPWSDGTIYWDHAGCCAAGQRLTTPSGNTNDGAWHHFVFQKSGGTKQIWKDGVLLANQAAGAAALVGLEDLFIGATDAAGTNKFAGLIDEFSVWDRSLTPGQITRLANGETALNVAAPEPAAASLLALALGALAVRRRRAA